MSPSTGAPYVLGDTSAEHNRLVRQAAIFEPFTERLFRDAGVGAGQRVLDIGSGVGDVAMLAARLVGASGVVVGVERDPATLATARSRVARAGLSNVSFMETDVTNAVSNEPFDAVVGRVILQYLPDAGAVCGPLPCSILPPICHCGRNARRSSIELSSVPARTWTWSWFSIAPSKRPGSPHRKCGSKFRSETTQGSCDGSTICCAHCCRACRQMNSPRAELAISIL
jgi:SAM-dependent methyltransferase